MPKSVDKSKRFKERDTTTFSKGGRGRDHTMFGQQRANPKKPGITGKVDARGPGPDFIEEGGKVIGKVGGLARPARPGCTGT